MYIKYYSLREIKKDRPLFFENKTNPERYNVWKNHLIVTDLTNGLAKVWQYQPEFNHGQSRLVPLATYKNTQDGIQAAKYYHEPEYYSLPEPVYTTIKHDRLVLAINLFMKITAKKA